MYCPFDQDEVYGFLELPAVTCQNAIFEQPKPRVEITVRIDGSSTLSGCDRGLEGISNARGSSHSISVGGGSIAGALKAKVDILAGSLLCSSSCDRTEYGDGDKSIPNTDL